MTLDIERIGMVIYENLEVMIQWKRGKLSDSTDTYQLVHTRLKTNTLIDLPLSGERFQKKI